MFIATLVSSVFHIVFGLLIFTTALYFPHLKNIFCRVLLPVLWVFANATWVSLFNNWKGLDSFHSPHPTRSTRPYGSCTYHLITDRGGSLQMITVLHREGSSQMITVLHRGGVSNDYDTPWILGCYIRNIISRDLTKKSDFYQLVKNNFWGLCQNYYNFT